MGSSVKVLAENVARVTPADPAGRAKGRVEPTTTRPSAFSGCDLTGIIEAVAASARYHGATKNGGG
jgi:hypothetical protein